MIIQDKRIKLKVPDKDFKSELQKKLICEVCNDVRRPHQILDGILLACEKCTKAVKISKSEARVLGIRCYDI